MEENPQKSERALQEEAILAFWKENNIFEKTIAKDASKDDYIFYEGPPTANAKPALHHLEARAFKDVIPRYKTMQGFHVPRRAGWDTHGLPVELQIEKALGLQSKKDIEQYGVALFNKACKDSVFTYIKDWETFTDRMGYWVDKKSAYYTFDASYMESLWHIVAEVDKKGLLYKDYKVVPWCPRCGTGLSSHELAQGYMDVKDLSVYAKFKVVGEENTYLLAWTTTPWTLPGNVALAVGKDIEYVRLEIKPTLNISTREGDSSGETKATTVVSGNYYIAKDRILQFPELAMLASDNYENYISNNISEEEFLSTFVSIRGSELTGMEYEPLYPYLKTEAEKKGLDTAKAFQVYSADFVTTTDGTGIVHIAPMYGADDFVLSTKEGLPKFHTVDETGHFIQGTDFLESRFAKDETVAVDIIKDLAHRGLLFKKEKYEHSYPHCWRCKTPLLYYARDSWYVAMSKLRDELLIANDTINWEPAHIKEGRFGEWLREVKDWAFSRERYWGTPLPVWMTEDGEKVVIDSVATLKSLSQRSGNEYYIMRHGEATHNLGWVVSTDEHNSPGLTEKGKGQVIEAAQSLKERGVDLIVISPFVRTRETAELLRETLGLSAEQVIVDARLREFGVRSFEGKTWGEYHTVFPKTLEYFTAKNDGDESYADVKVRVMELLYEYEARFQNKKIVFVTHGGPAWLMSAGAAGYSIKQMYTMIHGERFDDMKNAEVREIDFVPLPHNELYELDLHKPYIDEVELYKDGKKLARVKEVMDVWFDSGAMPFAQEHFMGEGALSYPADFISEAIDQTRGWFYTLLAVGVLMGRGAPYKNVICLGHLLDKDGKKMSKSIGNIVEPFEQMDRFGVDPVRWWMYSVNAPGESKNYDEKSVAEINNKVFTLFSNVLSFYELYRDKTLEERQQTTDSEHVLDKWIMARLAQVTDEVTVSLDAYDLFKPTRTIRDFIDDLSTWYLRRSRDRLRDGDEGAKVTLYTVLKTTAQLMAPFAPFFAEHVWQILRTDKDEASIHLSTWPKTEVQPLKTVLADMEKVRAMCTLGNALRKKENIPVRQPLQTFFITDKGLEQYYELIKDELNVKQVEIGDEVVFDMTITAELKLEGEYRELVRVVQDMRKEKGLAPQDEIALTLPETYSDIVATFGDDLKKTVGAKDIKLEGQDILIH